MSLTVFGLLACETLGKIGKSIKIRHRNNQLIEIHFVQSF